MRVLVVDDDEDVRALLALSLQTRGHDVVAVDTAEAGQAAVDPSIDALITDVSLPDLSGPELIHRLRSADDLPPRVVLLSALPIDHIAQDLGVVALSKPFTPADLDDALHAGDNVAADG